MTKIFIITNRGGEDKHSLNSESNMSSDEDIGDWEGVGGGGVRLDLLL